MNQLKELTASGNSVWYDGMRRSLATSGLLKRLVEEDGVTGVILGLSSFEKALGGTDEYDEDIARLRREGRGEEEIIAALAASDARCAADELFRAYEASGKTDGMVSVWLPPHTLNDIEKTAEAAKRLLDSIGRPNISVRVPATASGIAAAEELVYSGVSVNLTEVFSVSRYQSAAFSYVKALERRVRAGRPVDSVFGCVSVPISPVDVEMAAVVEDALKRITSHDTVAILRELSWRVALYNAKLVYLKHEDVFRGKTFHDLEKNGARPQRIVWEGTLPKGAHLDALLYAEGLCGGKTITAMALETMLAFRERGAVKERLKEGQAPAHKALKELDDLGLGLDLAASRLQEAALRDESALWEGLLKTVSERGAEALLGRPSLAPAPALWTGASLDAVRTLADGDFPARLWAKDESLWARSADDAVKRTIRNALGWLSAPAMMEELKGGLFTFAEEVRKAGFTECVLLGMGGSSLAPLVFGETFGPRRGYPRLTVLDTTDPEAVLGVAEGRERVEITRKLFIVSSKSGSTIEPLSLFEYFYSILKGIKGERAGENFIAITDPGTALEGFSRKYSFRRLFLNWRDIGGRFSALSYFGLLPAALSGIDVGSILRHALIMRAAVEPSVPPLKNPGLQLGALLAGFYNEGRDKVTFFLSDEISAFALWIEQLMAESTGKEGRGLIPITGEPVGKPSEYANDRVFVDISLKKTDEAVSRKLDALSKAGHPVLRFTLRDPYEIGAEFLRWEVAIAAAGMVMGINPFDQPDVESSKRLAMERLGRGAEKEHHEWAVLGSKLLKVHFGRAAKTGIKEKTSLKEALGAFLGLVREREYMGLLPYFNPMDKKAGASFGRIRKALRDKTGAAVLFGWGPRYLHSTGQLHKGGPDSGSFVIIAHGAVKDAPVPESHFTFSGLERSQAFGDMEALDSRGRRVILVDLKDPSEKSVKEAVELFEGVSIKG